MGTWSVDALGNDVACDWAFGLNECSDLSLIEATLAKALDEESKYLESPDACEALAAVETIARLQGNWGDRDGYSLPIDSWIEKTKLVPGKALAEKAHQVIERIMADDSELKELWQESEEFGAWQASLKSLAARVHV